MADLSVGRKARYAREHGWKHTHVMSMEPRVVRHLVDSGGMGRDALARLMGVPADHFEQWVEMGRMTYSRVQKLARHLHRPVLEFFAKVPPVEPVLADFRRDWASRAKDGASSMALPLSPADIVTVRHAWHLRARLGEIVAEMARGEQEQQQQRRHPLPPSLLIAPEEDGEAKATVYDSPEKVAEREARRLGLWAVDGRKGRQLGFDELRDAVERNGNALVFQEGMDMYSVRSVTMPAACRGAPPPPPEAEAADGTVDEECDGRTPRQPLHHHQQQEEEGEEGEDQPRPPLPHLILVNAIDAEGTRSFSLLHGYGHALLGRDGGDLDGYDGCICMEGGAGERCRRNTRKVGYCTDRERTEAWCDSLCGGSFDAARPLCG